jgi:hypothetical protein
MQKAITPTIPNDIQCNSSGTTINVTWSNAFPDQNYDIPPIINQFQIQYKLATATEWNKTNPINYDPNKASLYTESFTVSETGAYKVRLVAINDLPAKDSIQAYSSEITVSV